MGEVLSTLILLSIIVEFITNGIKAIFPAIKPGGSRIAALVTGTILSWLTGIGILESLDIGIILPAFDYAITGILISKGSNAVHDFATILDRNAR